MSFYKRIAEKEVDIPEALCIEFGQVIDISNNAQGIMDAICIAFKFGYMQGKRAGQVKGKEMAV